MAVTSVTIIAPASGFDSYGLRPATNIVWVGGTGPFDILYEWDTTTLFNSGNLITDTNLGVTGTTDDGLPPSDMGPIGTDWYCRVTITDTGDSIDEIQRVILDDSIANPTITANSQAGSPYGVDKLVDGLQDTYWRNQQNLNGGVTDIDFDFGAAESLDRLRMQQWLEPTSVPSSIELFWSDDGSAYTSVGTFSPSSTAFSWHDYTFGPLSHRYWRVRELETSSGSYWRVAQLYFMRAVTAGTFKLDLDAEGPTAAMNWNVALATLETEIEAFASITAVTATGVVGTYYDVEYTNPSETDINLMTVNDDSLTPGSAVISVTEMVKGSAGIEEVSANVTINFVDPDLQNRSLYVNNNIGVGFGSDADGPLGDGDPDDFNRHLYVNNNIGVGFGTDPFDSIVLGDGEPDDFNRYLYVNNNVTSDQPCPYVSNIAPSIQEQNGAVVIYGDSFGATQATYLTELRIYEDQDLSGAYVTMGASAWSDTEISAIVPAGATTGWLVVVHTNGAATCDGSTPKLLQVIQVPADPDAGWWLKTANRLNVHTGDHTVLPGNNVRTSFRKIMNAIGSGRVELPLGDPLIDTLIDPVTRQGVLVQTYIDKRMRYGWFAEDLSHDYNEEGDAIAVISGRGMEVVALWNKVLPQDYPASPTKNPVWVYGSNENFIQNPGFEDDLGSLLNNPGGEDGNNDEGDVEGWTKVGDDLVEATAYQDSLKARTGDWYIQVEASDNHSGLSQSVECEPSKVYHVQCYVKDPTAAGYRVTLSFDGAKDMTITGTYPNNYEYKDAIYAELGNVARNPAGNGTPGGATDGSWQVMDVEIKTGKEQTSLNIRVLDDYHTTGSIHGPWWLDDMTIEGWGLGLSPWVAFDGANHASNSFRLSTDGLAPSAHGCTINGLARYAGLEQVITLNALTKYTFSAWIKQATVAAGDSWSLAVRLNDGNETLVGIDQDHVPVAGAWEQLQFVAETPNLEEVEVIVRLVYTGSNNPVPCQVDDFSAVPGEPASTAGKILNDLLDKMALIDKLTYLNRTFTETLDSRGQPWPSNLSLDISPSESLYGVLSRLVALAHEWEIVPVAFPEGNTGFELNVYTARSFSPESGIGQNWVNDPEGPVIMPGDATIGGRILKSVFGVNTVMAIGDDGTWSRIQQHPWNDVDMDPSDPAPHGYDESFGQIEDVISVSATDATSIAQFAEARLADSKARESAIQIFMQRSSIIRPFLTFGVGDSLFVDMPPSNPNPPVDDGFGGYTRLNPQRVRSIQSDLAGEGSEVTFQVDIDRVIYEDQLAWNAMIAQLNERAPAENSSSGTGSVSGAGGAVSVIGGGGITNENVPHTHELDSSEIKNKVASGDVSGNLPGPLSVNALKGVPVDVSVPDEIEDQSTALVYNYDAKVLELQAGISGAGGGGGAFASGMILVDEIEITADTQYVTFSDIANTYKGLQLRIMLKSDNAAAWEDVYLRMGNGGVDTGATDYAYESLYNESAGGASTGQAFVHMNGGASGGNASAYEVGLIVLEISDQYADASKPTPMAWFGGIANGADNYAVQGVAQHKNTKAIDTIRLEPAVGTRRFTQGKVQLWALVENTGAITWTPMFDLLHSQKDSADTPDDEFDATTLDAKWTVVDGGVGTIDPLLAGSGTTEVYDLTSRPGWMMMQAGTDDVVTLRQDYTLPDGACMVVALEMTMELNAYSNGDNQNIKMALNDSDAGIASGEQITVMIEQDTSGDLWQIQANSDSDAGGNSMPVDIDLFSNLIYFRIMRETLTYTCFFSLDGITWTYLFADTHATAATNVWIGMKGSSALTKAAVGAFAWIRQGINDLDPWDPMAAVAVSGSGGGGGPLWVQQLADRTVYGETVHDYDDEFMAEAVDAGWTEVEPTGTTNWAETGKGRLLADTVSQASSDMSGLVKPLDSLSFPLTIETRITPTSDQDNYLMYGMVFSDGTADGSNLVVAMPYINNANFVNVDFRTGTFNNVGAILGSADQVIHAAGGGLHQRLIWSAANLWKFQYSMDGQQWLDVNGGTAQARTLTPTHFGLSISTWGSGVKRMAAYEYFRVTEADLSL